MDINNQKMTNHPPSPKRKCRTSARVFSKTLLNNGTERMKKGIEIDNEGEKSEHRKKHRGQKKQCPHGSTVA